MGAAVKQSYPKRKYRDTIYHQVQRYGRFCQICLSDLTKEEREEILKYKSHEYKLKVIEHLTDFLNNSLYITRKNDSMNECIETMIDLLLKHGVEIDDSRSCIPKKMT